MIHDSILGTIGNTPVVRINRLAPSGSTMYVKCEAFNPLSSVKDRLAIAIIEDAERRGALKPGQTVIEATSGNTGIALAMVCAVKGYPFVALMSDSFSVERRKLMRALGAKVVLVPAAERATGTSSAAKSTSSSARLCLVPLPSTSPHLGVGEALDFGKLDRLGRGQDALAFVALARPAPPHNNGRESAGLLRAPGQRRIARRQENEMPEVGAVQAQWAGILHEQQVAGAATRRARPLFNRRDHDEIRRSTLPLDRTLRQVRRHPMRPVRTLDGGIPADAEPQLAAVASAGDVIGL